MTAYGREVVQVHTLLTLCSCTLCRQTISWPLFAVLTFLLCHKISLAIKTGDTFTHYISWNPYFHGLLVFSITYPQSLALYKCVLSASHSTWINLGEKYRVPTEQEGGWARFLAWNTWRCEKSLDPARNLTSITHSSIQATDYPPHQLHYHSYHSTVSLILNICVTVVTDCLYSSHISFRKKLIKNMKMDYSKMETMTKL